MSCQERAGSLPGGLVVALVTHFRSEIGIGVMSTTVQDKPPGSGGFFRLSTLYEASHSGSERSISENVGLHAFIARHHDPDPTEPRKRWHL